MTALAVETVLDGAHSAIIAIEDVLDYESVDVWRINRQTGQDEYGQVREVLEDKRCDEQYPHVLRSLRTGGFTKGIRIHPEHKRVTDGHHRIAAAIDLGYRFVPYEYRQYCDDDSGEWGR